MNMVMNSFATLFCLTLVPGVLFGIYWYFATKKGWNSLKLLSIGLSFMLVAISIVLGLFARDNEILIFGVVISIIQGTIVWNWNIFSSRIIKRLKLRK